MPSAFATLNQSAPGADENASTDMSRILSNAKHLAERVQGAALLAGDDETPSMRGKVDLIYIDPPFDSKADYRNKVSLKTGDIEQSPTAIEQFAYSDTWADGTASYLAMIVPSLGLMRVKNA